MAWKSIDKENGVFTLADVGYEWVHIDNVSEEELNSSKHSYDETRNPYYFFREVEGKDVLSSLPSGIYHLNCADLYSNWNVVAWKSSIKLKLFELDSVNEVLEDFEDFRKNKKAYDHIGTRYKSGVLLYGPPGTGKTSAVNMILDSLKLDDAIVFYIENALPLNFLRELRKDNRLKVFVFEELTQTIQKSGLNKFLTFLDGESSLENSYCIATTNYPEDLPGNITRIGRFDKLIRIDKVSDFDRKKYLEFFLERKLTDKELSLTNNENMASLKELVLTMLKKKVSLIKALDVIKKHRQIVKRSFKNTSETRIGFSDEDD